MIVVPLVAYANFSAEDVGVVLRLLEPIRGRFGVRLGFDDGEENVASEIEEEVGDFLLQALGLAAGQDDPPRGDTDLFLIVPLSVGFPAGRLQLRADERPACLGFVHERRTPDPPAGNLLSLPDTGWHLEV